jgi:beta-glucosidase
VSCIPGHRNAREHPRRGDATRELNAGYLTVMLEGKYTDAYLAQTGKEGPKYTARTAHHPPRSILSG